MNISYCTSRLQTTLRRAMEIPLASVGLFQMISITTESTGKEITPLVLVSIAEMISLWKIEKHSLRL